MLAIMYKISGVNTKGGVCVYGNNQRQGRVPLHRPYRIVEIALVFLESIAICKGWNQDSGFLRVTSNTDGNSAGALLEVS